MSPILKMHRQVIAFLVELSFYTKDAPLKLADSASLKDRCTSYKEFLAADLKKVGWVAAKGGIGGGYFLAVKPDEITLRAVDEFVCRNRAGTDAGECRFLKAAEEALKVFPRTTIREVADHAHG